jgi:hypothetical protein
MLSQQKTRLAASGLSHEHVSFNGSHRIDREVLGRLAKTSD